MYIVGGTTSTTIASELSKILQQPQANINYTRFPDDELYLRIINDLEGEDVIIIQTTYPDTKIIELFLIQDAVFEYGAKSITIVIPYFGYSRQDKQFKEGEPISARAIAEHISLHADQIITIDPHKEHILQFFTVPAISCSAIPEIAEYLKKKDIDFILAPDKGAKDRAKATSTCIGCEYDFLEKKRIDGCFLLKEGNLSLRIMVTILQITMLDEYVWTLFRIKDHPGLYRGESCKRSLIDHFYGISMS